MDEEERSQYTEILSWMTCGVMYFKDNSPYSPVADFLKLGLFLRLFFTFSEWKFNLKVGISEGYLICKHLLEAENSSLRLIENCIATDSKFYGHFLKMSIGSEVYK
ncbi:uncharacterized protein LOC127282472 [Leptopilina boulardi]|uniref:uncharacterized protein LOC127282472 n=1 Tax=Leptopilina boulardi TaxID=63433 RepID=UPI0021F56A23|nr:uncharacterized protein LOC127282472 [Leptopilina boulardi]